MVSATCANHTFMCHFGAGTVPSYDDIHEKVMKTMDKLMDEEDYDADEAIHAAVKRRKSLLKDFIWKLKIVEEES